MLSSSTVADAVQYSRSRLLRWRIVALWALLVATRLVAAPLPGAASVVAPALFLALALVLLRLWDDLADLEHDRAQHPQRVLVQSANRRSFAVVVALGLLLMVVALLEDGRRVAVYGTLLASLGLLYHSGLRTRVPRAVRAGLVLIKYPVLVFLAGAGPSRQACVAGLALYVALLVYDWRDDPELRAAPWPQVLLGGGVGMALIAWLFLVGGAP
ncbi:MAG: hypothetical protein JSV45_14075 [Chromatiales bacterium]|nr:MAG: hypothetical protein JSV45_14075 [Chromatiales bacterium]